MQRECQVRWDLPRLAVAKHRRNVPIPGTFLLPCLGWDSLHTLHWDPAKADGAGDGEAIQPVLAVGEGRFLEQSGWKKSSFTS